MSNETFLYTDPVALLHACCATLSEEERAQRFAPDGEGIFLQEVVDASRVFTMEDLLDSFSIDLDDPQHPDPKKEELWIVFAWHPVKKQLIRGDELRARLAEPPKK